VAVTVTPSVKGRATIHDKDILIFCISQLMAALNAGRQVSRTLHLTAHDLLVATNRDTSGDAYRACATPSSGWRARASPPTSPPAAWRRPVASA
jgi:plasmid replication initiation protein